MDKHKDVFFVVFFQPPQVLCASPLPATTDPDQLINCDLMDGRDAFLTLARERHWEFSSLRRAKFSSMTMLCELHNQGSDRFVYTCNNCRLHVETRYHCKECDDFDLCVNCYQAVGHCHPMDRLGLGLDMDEAQPQVPQNPAEARKQSIQKCIQYLLHACQCKDAQCKLPGCVKIKRILKHTRDCKLRQLGNCTVCKQFLVLCYTHAKSCNEQSCPVPICARIKVNLREQRLQKRMRQERFMQQRMVNMEQFSSNSAAPAPSVSNSVASPIAISPQAQSNKVPPSPTSSKSPSTSTSAPNVTVTPTSQGVNPTPSGGLISTPSPAPQPSVGKGGPVPSMGEVGEALQQRLMSPSNGVQMSGVAGLSRPSDHVFTNATLSQPMSIPGDQAQSQNEGLINILLDQQPSQNQYTDMPNLLTRQDTPPQAMGVHPRTIMPNTMVREMYQGAPPPGYSQTTLLQQQQQQHQQAMLQRQLQQQYGQQSMMSRMQQAQQNYRFQQMGGGGGGVGYHSMQANMGATPQQQQQSQTQLQQMLRQQPQYMPQTSPYAQGGMMGHQQPQQGPMGPPPQYPAGTIRSLPSMQAQQQQQQQMGGYVGMQSRQMMSPAAMQAQQMSLMQGHSHPYGPQQMGPQMMMDPAAMQGADPASYMYQQQFTMNTNNNNCGGLLMHDIQYVMPPPPQPHSLYETTPQERLNDLAENL
eukprot:Em0022g35a